MGKNQIKTTAELFGEEDTVKTTAELFGPSDILQTSAPARLRIQEAMQKAGIVLPTEDPGYAKFRMGADQPLSPVGYAAQKAFEPAHALAKGMIAPAASAIRQLAGRVGGEQPKKAAEEAGKWAESVMGFGGYPSEESELAQNVNELMGQAGKGFEDLSHGISAITGLPQEDVLAAETALLFVIPIGMEVAYWARVRSGLKAVPKGERVTGNRLMSELIDAGNDLKIISPEEATRMKPVEPGGAPKPTAKIKGTVRITADAFEGITMDAWKDIKYKVDLVKNEPMHPKVPEYMKELSEVMARNKITEATLQEGMRLSETIDQPLRELTLKERAGVAETHELASEALRTGKPPPEIIDRPTKSMAPDGQLVNETMKLAPEELAGDASSAIVKTSEQAAKEMPLVDVPETTYMYAGVDLRQAMHELGEFTRVGPALEVMKQQARENFHSPLWVMEKYAGERGVRIYNRNNLAALDKAKWVDPKWDSFKKATKGIRDGDFLDTGVARVRDNQLTLNDVVKMAPDEYAQYGFTKGEVSAIKKQFGKAKKWFDFQEESYDIMMRDYGKSVITAEQEARLWRAAKKDKAGSPPTESFLSALTENEKAVFDIYKKRIENYMPHLFDRSEILAYAQKELTNVNKSMTGVKPGSRAYGIMEGQRAKLAKSIESIQGGAPLMWDIIPESVNFKFFKVRRGMEGYQMSSKKAYRAYLNGIAKKIFDEPALRANMMEFPKLPENVKPYTQWYLREFMGYNNTPLADLWGNIKSLMWIKTLGFNPRSAVVNLTQRLNTIVDAGPINSIEGYRRCFTKEGRALFEESGLAKQVPTALMEHGFTGGKAPATPLEFLREASGWMFSQIEKGNLKHALLANDTMLRRQGVTSALTRMDKSIAGAQKVQFRYGRVGTPKVLRGPGGVAFQFWSYPIKQIELMSHWAKKNPMKLVAWLAAAEGTRRSLNEFLDIDLSSALGVVTNYGELIAMFRALPEGDIKKIFMHGRAAGIGGGVAPYGLGPAVQSAQGLTEVVSGTIPAVEGLMNMVEPITMQRVRQDIRALAEGADEAGEYPVREKYGSTLMYKEDPKELFTRVFLGRPSQEFEVSEKAGRKRLEDIEATQMIQQMAEAIVAGEPGKAMELATKYKLPFSKSSIKNAYLRYMLTKDQRMLMDELRGESKIMFREHMRK